MGIGIGFKTHILRYWDFIKVSTYNIGKLQDVRAKLQMLGILPQIELLNIRAKPRNIVGGDVKRSEQWCIYGGNAQ